MFVKTKAICYGYFDFSITENKAKRSMVQCSKRAKDLYNIRKENAVLFLNYISHKNMHNTNK